MSTPVCCDAIRDHDEPPTARTVAAEHMTTARQIRLQLLRNAAAEAGDRVMDQISISPRG